MKMNLKVTALIYSTKETAEVTIIERVGNNKYLADFRGKKCAAMFNPFQGIYYVDDLQGCFSDVSDEELDTLLYELKFISESTERELDAYRKLGSVKHLKNLRAKELRRERNWKKFKRISRITLISAGSVLMLWIFISGIINILA